MQIKKEITIGEIVTVVSVAFAVLAAYFSMDKRVTLVEDVQARQVKIDDAQDAERQRLRIEITEWLVRMDNKLDRLLHR